MIEDGTIGVWFGNNDYTYVTWTLSVELWASFYVFLLAETVVFYQNRWILYLLPILFLYIPRITDDAGLTHYKFRAEENTSFLDVNLRAYLPLFTYGVAFSDLENLSKYFRPLDSMRDLNFWIKIPINLALIFLFVSYGSLMPDDVCTKRDDGDCTYYNAITFGTNKYTFWFFQTIGAISGFIFALTSEYFQWVLASAPFWFLGQISYTLYLVHLLIIDWGQVELQSHMTDNGVDYDLATLYVFLIFTPVLLLVSWGLEVVIDTPSKNLAH